MEAVSAICLNDIISKLRNFDVIGIDEGQFVSFYY